MVAAWDPAELLADVRAGRPRAVGRAIGGREPPPGPELVAAVAPDTGRARVLGLTGRPGGRQVQRVAALVTRLRGRGERVGVLAVDPSRRSPGERAL